MKYCANCGQQLNDDDRFCGKCGTQFLPAQYSAPAGRQESNLSDVSVGAVNSMDEIAAANQNGSPTGVNGAGGVPHQEYPIYTPPSQTRLRWPYILAGILGVLLLSVVLLYHFGNFGAPVTPRLAPVDTEVFICIKPNLLQVRNLSNLQEIYQSDPETNKALENLLQELHRESDLDFEQDIKPWLGKEAAAFIPRQRNPEELVAAVEYRNEEKARTFIDKITRDENKYKKTYNGIAVTSIEDNFWVALTDGYMFLASDEGLLQSTLDRKLGEKSESLADNDDYKKVISSLPWNRSAFCYIDTHRIADDIRRESGVPGSMSQVLDSYQGLGMSLSVLNQGVRCDYVQTFDKVPEYLTARTVSKAELKKVMSMMPEDSLGFASNSYLLNVVQEQYAEFMNTGDDYLCYSIREFENEIGIDMEKDVLDVLRGDAALAVMPQNGRFFGERSVPLSGIMLLGVKDQKKAGNTIQQVANELEYLDIAVDRQKINGNETYFFGESRYERIFGVGIQDNLVIIGSSPETTERIMEKRSGSISKQKNYKQAFDNLPGSWEPQLYLDIERTVDLLPVGEMNSEERMYLSLFKPIKSIGQASSAANTRKDLIQGAAVVTIK